MKCVKKGGQEGGYLEDIEGPDQRHGGHGHCYIMNDVFLPQGIYPESFVLISLLELCQDGGGSFMAVHGGH